MFPGAPEAVWDGGGGANIPGGLTFHGQWRNEQNQLGARGPSGFAPAAYFFYLHASEGEFLDSFQRNRSRRV